MITAADVWPLVKLRLDLEESIRPLVDTYIAEIEQRIKHYCNIRSIPDGLLYTWASMVIDAVRVELQNVAKIEETVGGGAVNVKVGDTSVSSGGSGGGLSNTAKTVIDEVVLNYRVDLNRYRRMRWGG